MNTSHGWARLPGFREAFRLFDGPAYVDDRTDLAGLLIGQAAPQVHGSVGDLPPFAEGGIADTVEGPFAE